MEQFLPFDEALRVARVLRLASQAEWRAWCKTGARPANVPSNPNQVYVNDGWGGWEHWLGTSNLEPATSRDTPQAASRPAGKRVAAGGAPTSGESRGKRRRR